MKNLFFPIIFIYKRFNFCGFFLPILHDLTQLLQCIENICYLFLLMGLIVAFFIFNKSEEFMYDPLQFGFLL